MQGDNSNTTASSGSRWNPTKEQIDMLEGLYKQGIRTPTAEQIQQMTTRLRVYGHIEGKNVFYWFQNHKARQRQKQKQENMAYINRLLHKPHSYYHPPPPLNPNVVSSPYFLPQGNLGFYPQCPKVLIPGGFRRRNNTHEKQQQSTTGLDHFVPPSYYEHVVPNHGNNDNKQKTLDLFPLEPTGVIEEKTGKVFAEDFTSEMQPGSNYYYNANCQDGFVDAYEHPYFDFLSGARG